jgi:filamentous hemagglutinin family protein
MELTMTHAKTIAVRLNRRVSPTRKRLMMSCASLALATAALNPQAVRAQAFQGTISSNTGSVTRSTPTATTETITIGTNTATINWSPTHQEGSGTIDFLPVGNTATFTSSAGIADYTVLNRILPTDATRGISLNGHVISTLQGTNTTGGRIWFYSPGGILIGSTAVIDVGSLLLTTNDVTSLGTTSNGFNATFGSPSGSTSKIQVQNGAQINALQAGSYVAMIAPRIEQGGKVRVNGSAAYVAAEQATLTINQGLFDIQVDVGTSDPNGIVHTGETSGPANVAATDNHSIYMVAMPKNQALEMLLGGTVGFDGAAIAQVQNGQIILSSGYSTHDRNFDQSFLGGAITGTPADMRISGGNFTSSVTAAATGNIEANGGGGTLAFAGNVSLQGLHSASLVAHDGDTITVGGNARISSDDLRTFTTSDPEVGIDAIAGNAAIQAQSGGSIQIAGSASVTADAGSAISNSFGTSGSTQGGFASITAPGGTVSIGGAASVSASALGAVSSGPVADGGNSFGGSASLSASDGGSLTVAGALDLRADGTGSFTSICCGGSGGLGEGGRAGISTDNSGSVAIGGAAVISAAGQGGAVLSSPQGGGGEGDGGTAYLDAFFGGSISFASPVQLFADGVGGNALLQGGTGYGGSSENNIDGGSITAAGDLRLRADGFGGTGIVGGDGYGGESMVGFTGGEGEGSGGSLTVGGQTWLEGIGQGGAGLDNSEGTGGQGGDGYGGFAWFYVSPDQSAESTLTLNLHDTYLTSNANGGAGGNGLIGGNGGNAFSQYFIGEGDFGNGEGSFFGGISTFEMFAGTGTIGDLQVYSTSRGGNGGVGSSGAGGSGGDAAGGQSSIIIGGNLTATRALSYDRAFGGNGGSGTTQGDGGSAQGGDASIDVIQGGHLTGNVDIATTAFGGLGNVGGDATGGFSSLDVEGILTGGSILIDADATGGAGLTGGDASGGSAKASLDGGDVNISGQTFVHSTGAGGAGLANPLGTGGLGGDGYGGFASLDVSGPGETPQNTNVALGTVLLNADSSGGSGGSGTTGGAGGYAQAGEASFSVSGTSLTAGGTVVVARAFGGDGGAGSAGLGGSGGNADGGTADLFVDTDSTLGGTLYTAQTNALGGSGGTGSSGRGDGGSAQSGIDSALIDGTATFGGSSDAFNGFIVTSFAQGGAGNTAGSATGGSSSVDVGGSLTVAGLLQATARAQGGAGTAQGGSGTGGSASVSSSGHLTTNTMTVGTNSTGGSGNIGGDAFGGSDSLQVNGALTAGTITIIGYANAGAGIAQGGDAQGGFAAIDVFGGSANLSNAATLNVDATGGNASSGSGGSALGGQAFVEAAEGGNLTGGNLTATANAIGGNGTTAGLAGGGQIDILSDEFGENGATSIALNRLTLAANGTLGAGATDGETIGYGGAISLSAFGGSLSANTLIAQTNGSNFGGSIRLASDVEFGGNKGQLSFGTLTGVANGADLGGFIFVTSGSGSVIDLGNANLTAIGADSGQIRLSAGEGCSCEGEAVGETAALPAGGGIAASNLTLNTSGNILMTLSGGADISVAGALDGHADGVISMFDDGTGGAIRAHIIDLSAFTIIDSADIIADIIHFTSLSDMTLGTLSATNSIDLDSGGDLTTGDLAAGTVRLSSEGDMRFGNLTGDHTDFDAQGSVTGGDIHVTTTAEGNADGAIVLGNIVAGPNVPVGTGFSVGFSSGTSITVGNVTGAGHVGFATLGNLTTGNLTAGDLVMLLVGHDISTGAITTAGNGRVYIGDASMFQLGGGGGDNDGNDFDPNIVLALNPVRTHGSIAINGPVSTGTFQAAAGGNFNTGGILAVESLSLDAGGNVHTAALNSKNITANADGELTVDGATGGAIRLTSGGGMNVGNFNATDLIALIAGGDLATGNLSATNSLSLDSKGDIVTGDLASNLVTVKAASDLTVRNVLAGTAATFTAGDLAKFIGIVNSPSITVTSGDIDITEGASLGVQGLTNLLTLNAVSHGLPILLGDGGSANPGAPGQYHLNEDGDIHAASLVINAVGATPGLNPDVRIFDAQIGEGGTPPNSVTLNTPGSIFVEGDLRYINAAPTASLTLNAGHVLEINTDTGSIVITDSTGHLTGTLALNADNVWIGSGSLLDQLEANPNFAGRDAALAAASATPNQDGFVRAGTITSRVANSFFAQNSGTADLFAGIDTGAGGLSILSAGATPATLIIYGRQTNANGTVITNNDFLNSVNLQGTGGFTNDSAVNGCTIGATCGQQVPTPGIDMASILGPLDETNSPSDDDKKKDKDKGDEGDDGSSVDPSLRLINTTPINLDHQIDDPITSGGDVVIGGSVSPN